MVSEREQYEPPEGVEELLDAVEYSFERLLNHNLAATNGVGDPAMPSGDALLDAAARVVNTAFIQQHQDARGNGGGGQRRASGSGNRSRRDDGDGGGNRGRNRPSRRDGGGGGRRNRDDDDDDDQPRRARNDRWGSRGGNRNSRGGSGGGGGNRGRNRNRGDDQPRDVAAFCDCPHENWRDFNNDYEGSDCDPEECRREYNGQDAGPCGCIRPEPLQGGVVYLVSTSKNDRGYPSGWRWVEEFD